MSSDTAQDTRTPRQPKMLGRLYRVIGYEYPSDPYVSSWEYKRLADAQWRAAHLDRLVDFSESKLVWKPVPTSQQGDAGRG